MRADLRAVPAVRPSEDPVLVTGATGFLGGSLVRRLLSGGGGVRVLTRSATRAQELADRGAAVFLGDITDRDALRTAAHGVTTIYHFAGRLFVPGVPAQEYRRTHVEGTMAVLAACAAGPSVRRLVHVSTTGVLGATGGWPAGEDAPIRPRNIYEETKAEAEWIVRQSWRDGLPAVIARPGLVYGPGDLHLLPFFDAVLRRRFRPIGRRTVWLHPIYVDDLAEALILCGRHSSAIGKCFHLAGPRPVSLAGLADAIARAGGTRVPPGHIPMLAARTVALVGDQLPPGMKRVVPLTTSRLDFLTHSRVYDTAKATRVLAFTAATDLPTGIARTLDWYHREGYLPATRAA